MVSDMIETDWDKLFREKLKYIWKEINSLVESDLDKDLVQKRFKSIGDDFGTIFQKEGSPVPIETNDYYYTKFHSVGIPLGSFTFLIPHSFITLAQLKQKINLDQLFDMSVSWRMLISYFYETIYNIRKPLKENDIKIMSIITRYQPKSTDKVIPFSLADIGKLAGTIGKRQKIINENTVGKRTTYLYQQNILIDRFLINPWAVGYSLRTLIYEKKFDIKMNEWDKYTKYKQFFMSNKILRIIRLPQHAEDEFIFPDFTKSNEVIQYWYSTNISQLSSKETESFTTPPNFEVLKASDYTYTKFHRDDDSKWINKLLDLTYSTKTRKEELFASLNKINKNKRLEKAFKFLSFISKEGRIRYPINQTAKRADLEEILFLDLMRFFIDQKIINFATRPNYISCNYRIGVAITSLEKPITQYPRLQLFLQNLLELPLSVAFIGEFIICAYINLPLKWVGVFTTYLNMLMTFSDLQIEFGTHMSLQSYLHWNTPFSEDTILTSYGVLYNPQFELNSAKIE